MGLLSRLSNLLSGIFSSLMGGVESKNPEAIYQASIDSLIKKHVAFKKATAGLVVRRSTLEEQLKRTKKTLEQYEADLDAAVEANDDKIALLLIQKIDTIKESGIPEIENELSTIIQEVDDAKAGIQLIEQEIERLRNEKQVQIARFKSAQSRLQMQEALDGLSVDAGVVALDNVRKNIMEMTAQVKLNSELQNSDLDTRLRKLRQNSAPAAAKEKLEQLKQERAKQQAEKEKNMKELRETLENTKAMQVEAAVAKR